MTDCLRCQRLTEGVPSREVHLGWRLSEEGFYQSSGLSSVMNDIKIRGSYAVVGNTNIGAFPYAGLFSSAQYATQGGIAFSNTG
jgi:TonB-dependent starch-binding outer membrane protein SusC